MNRYAFTKTIGDKLNNTFYPDIPEKETDIYVIVPKWTRLDLLANKYYQDPSLWFIIASINNLNGDSLFISEPTRLRIPIDPYDFISALERE